MQNDSLYNFSFAITIEKYFYRFYVLIYIFILLNFMCMGVWLNVCRCTIGRQCPWRPGDMLDSPGTGCEPPHRSLESSLGPVNEAHTESSLASEFINSFVQTLVETWKI